MPTAPENFQDFETERTLGAQRLAQYVQRERCERYLRFALFPAEAKSLAARYRVPFDALSPLLSGAGQTFERDIFDELSARERVRDLRNTSAAAFVAALKEQAPGRTFYYQPRLEGRVGGWACEGYADLIQVERGAGDDNDQVALTVLDIKASRRETVGFRLQVAFYARLLLDAASQAGLRVASIEGTVLSRAHASNDDGEPRERLTDPDAFARFDLALYLDEIEHLVATHDSDVSRAARAGFESASFHLGAHCDGCPYNSVCFIHAAEREDLSLVPALTSNEKGALRAAGYTTLRALAGLMNYEGYAMKPAPAREPEAERLAARYPLAERLPALVQRARAALRRFDPAV
jgi:hypothetical protein